MYINAIVIKYVNKMDAVVMIMLLKLARKRNITMSVIIMASRRASSILFMLRFMSFSWVSTISISRFPYFAFMAGRVLLTASITPMVAPPTALIIPIPMAGCPFPWKADNLSR